MTNFKHVDDINYHLNRLSFAYTIDHLHTTCVLNAIRNESRSRIMSFIRENDLFINEYFQVTDNPAKLCGDSKDSLSMFNSKCCLFLDPLSIALYLKKHFIAEFILDLGANCLNNVYASGIQMKASGKRDFLKLNPLCVAVRRENIEGLQIVMKKLSLLLRETSFKTCYYNGKQKNVFEYEDIVSYAIIVLRQKGSFPLTLTLRFLCDNERKHLGDRSLLQNMILAIFYRLATSALSDKMLSVARSMFLAIDHIILRLQPMCDYEIHSLTDLIYATQSKATLKCVVIGAMCLIVFFQRCLLLLKTNLHLFVSKAINNITRKFGFHNVLIKNENNEGILRLLDIVCEALGCEKVNGMIFGIVIAQVQDHDNQERSICSWKKHAREKYNFQRQFLKSRNNGRIPLWDLPQKFKIWNDGYRKLVNAEATFQTKLDVHDINVFRWVVGLSQKRDHRQDAKNGTESSTECYTKQETFQEKDDSSIISSTLSSAGIFGDDRIASVTDDTDHDEAKRQNVNGQSRNHSKNRGGNYFTESSSQGPWNTVTALPWQT